MGGVFSSNTDEITEDLYVKQKNVWKNYRTRYSIIKGNFQGIEIRNNASGNYFTNLVDRLFAIPITEKIKIKLRNINEKTKQADIAIIKSDLDIIHNNFKNIIHDTRHTIDNIQFNDLKIRYGDLLLPEDGIINNGSHGSIIDMINYIKSNLDELIKDVNKTIKFYNGKDRTTREQIWAYTLGNFAVFVNLCGYDYKCKSHEGFIQNTLTPISSEIAGFISDIRFVNRMFTSLNTKLENFDLSQKEAEIKMCNSYIGSIKDKLRLRHIE